MQSQRQKVGQAGEDIACDYLKKKGFQILNRNFRTKWGELDIVALSKKTLVFVEVKTLQKTLDRPSEFLPEDEITPHKANQLRTMSQIYLSANKLPQDTACQIDIIAIELLDNNQISEIRHIENAIEDY